MLAKERLRVQRPSFTKRDRAIGLKGMKLGGIAYQSKQTGGAPPATGAIPDTRGMSAKSLATTMQEGQFVTIVALNLNIRYHAEVCDGQSG